MQKYFIFLTFLAFYNADTVCDETTLINELRADIIDNGKLDCLRYPRKPNPDQEETIDQMKNRLAAVWDSDCSFEAHYDWHSKIKQTYGLNTGLVNSDGQPVITDSPDEADICELIRALIHANKLPTCKPDVTKLTEDCLDSIDCVGDSDEGQSEICAVSGQSSGQGYSWTIMLEGLSFNINNKPVWIKPGQADD